MTAIMSRVLLVACAVLLGASFAYCDSFLDPTTDILYTATVGSTSATLTVLCTVSAVCGNDFLGDVTLKGFTFSGSPTTGSGTVAGYTVVNGGQNNDAVASGGGCNGTQPGMAVCWDAPSTLIQLGTGANTFVADYTSLTSTGTLHVQATGYNNSSGIGTGGDKVFAISEDLVAGKPPSVPEPSTGLLSLLGGISLAGLALLRKL